MKSLKNQNCAALNKLHQYLRYTLFELKEGAPKQYQSIKDLKKLAHEPKR